MTLRSIFFGLCGVLLFACGHQHEHDEVLEQAGKIHLEAVKMDETIKPRLEKLSDVKKRLEQKQGELSVQESQMMQQIATLERSYAFWDENHVEVPGFEHAGHEHDHDHDHDHDHGPGLEVSSEDMLLIQQEFKDTLSSIAARLEKLAIPDSLMVQ